MNKIDFLKYNQFPLSSETLNALQDMIFLAARIASLGGNYYILSGCEISSGGVATPGFVVINGEILPFKGGYVTSYVIIKETKSSVDVYDEKYEDIYISREVVFGTGSGQIPWSNFKRIRDVVSLASDIASLSTTLNNHINNHTVAWNNVQGKPSAYTPIAHSHKWSEISEKPATYPPSTHTHIGRVVYFGEFSAQGSITKYFGEIDVTCERIATGKYRLTHNIGHASYIVLGVGIDVNTVSLRCMENCNQNDCIVTASDDESLNNAQIRFIIMSFQ